MNPEEISKPMRLWSVGTEDGALVVGFTESFLESVGTIWSIIPRHGSLKQGDPIAHLETAKSLCPVKSPFSGKVVWNKHVLHCPETITSETRLFTIHLNKEETL